MIEPWFTIVVVLLILAYARMGAMIGLFYEIPNMMLLLFALLVTLRYWYLVTDAILSRTTLQPGAAACMAFWALFLAVCVPVMILTRRINIASQPRYPRVLDAGLGFVFGLASASIAICCVMTSVTLLLPAFTTGVEPVKFLVPWDRVAVHAFQTVERKWFGIPATDPSHTRFPTFRKADADNFQKSWR